MITNSFTTFIPVGTATISGTTTTANVALPIAAPIACGSERPQVRVYNGGTTPAFIAFGDSTVTATVNHIPVAPSGPEVFTVPFGATHVAAIYGTGTGTIYLTSGFGA
jgi:hypothetical protein